MRYIVAEIGDSPKMATLLYTLHCRVGVFGHSSLSPISVAEIGRRRNRRWLIVAGVDRA